MWAVSLVHLLQLVALIGAAVVGMAEEHLVKVLLLEATLEVAAAQVIFA